jgi:Glycosyltransferase family 87
MRAWTVSHARWAPVVVVVALSLWALDLQASLSEYLGDAGPAVSALVAGNLHRFLTVQPLMGSFSVLARAPFALVAKLAGGGEPAEYRAGVLVCALAAAAVGVWLVRLRRVPPSSLLLVPLLAILTPGSVQAVHDGHPEEILGGALCVAAVLLAPRRALWAGVVLGLAIATKQWAVVAVPPVVLAAPPGRRVRLVAVAAVGAALLALPFLAANPSAFIHRSHQASVAPASTVRATVWFLVAQTHRVPLHLGAGLPTSFTVYRIPSLLAQATHPLIVLLAPLLGLAVWRRRGDPLALLALLLLLRCVLDPGDNEYYHAPFLLALLAWETARGRDVRGAPLGTLFACGGLWLTFRMDTAGAAPELTNAVYLLWTTAVSVVLLSACGLLGRRRAQPFGGPVDTPSSGASWVPGQAPQSPLPAAFAASASRINVSAYSPRTDSKK